MSPKRRTPNIQRRISNERVEVGGQPTVTVHEGGSIVLTPLRPTIAPKTAAAAAKRLIKKNSALFKRLS